MFIVQVISPLDDQWEERDVVLAGMAKRKHDTSETSFSRDGASIRITRWYVHELSEAKKLMRKLGSVEGVHATFREK
jgi:hypothetical protein